jgi:hypothetical protein
MFPFKDLLVIEFGMTSTLKTTFAPFWKPVAGFSGAIHKKQPSIQAVNPIST